MKQDILKRLVAALESAHDCYQELSSLELNAIERADWKLDRDAVETAMIFARNEFNGAIIESRERKNALSLAVTLAKTREAK